MRFVDQSSLISLHVFEGAAPRQQPKVVPITLDFVTDGSDIAIDLEQLEQDLKLGFVQGIYCDNTLSGVNFSLTVQISGQTLTIRSGAQAFLPVFAPNSAKFVASTFGAQANAPIKMQFTNFPVTPYVW